MAHALHDPVRHNAWATTQLLAFCRRLDAQTLNATVPGTYGTIMATLRHIIYCEIDFLDRLLGREATNPWQLDDTTGLDVLSAYAVRLAADWKRFLAGAVDSEYPLPPDEGTHPIPAGLVIAVVLYHGNEHRGRSAPSSARLVTNRPTSRPGPTPSPLGGYGSRVRMNIKFNGKIWFWKGPAPWYFVTVPAPQGSDIKAISASVTYGWGVIPVQVRLGKSVWQTSLFPKDGSYLVPIKASVRTAEQLVEGDTVTIHLEVR